MSERSPFGSGLPSMGGTGDTESGVGTDTEGELATSSGADSDGGTGSMATDGIGDSTTDSCPEGTLDCPCAWPATCDDGLTCEFNVCVDTDEPAGTTTGDGESPLPCDADFAFSPDPPGPGSSFKVYFTDPDPLVYIGLKVDGPVSMQGSFEGIPAEDPWTWEFSVLPLDPGQYTFSFTRDSGVVHATCERLIQ